jgi:hypothetical protein
MTRTSIILTVSIISAIAAGGTYFYVMYYADLVAKNHGNVVTMALPVVCSGVACFILIQKLLPSRYLALAFIPGFTSLAIICWVIIAMGMDH